MPASDVSGNRAGYVNKFHQAELPQQNTTEQRKLRYLEIYGGKNLPKTKIFSFA